VVTNNIFKRLVYIYIGTSNYDTDYGFYKDVLGAKRIWEFKDFGAHVAAFDICGEPYLLIADHVHASSKRLMYEVDHIDDAARDLEDRGWKASGERFEIPDGPCIDFTDASGNEYAIIQMVRPYALENEFKKKEG
jgi:predicted enzyme related to lactoylglutathione lyase